MAKVCMVYITFPSRKEAKRIAKILLDKHLAACCNIFPIESMYWWKGKIENSNEFVLIAKTLRKKLKQLKDVVKKNHPYTVPYIGVIEAEANEEYFSWMKEVLK
jgi:periplasmic divalent cation tolerance protein